MALAVSLMAIPVSAQVVIDGDVDADWPTSGATCIEDSGGCDDAGTSHTDMNQACVLADATPATTAFLLYQFDEYDIGGGNSMDGCWLLDTNQNDNVDIALCFTAGGQPLALEASYLYTCNDTQTDRCAGSAAGTFTGTCALDGDTPEPAALGCAHTPPQDSAVECSIPLADLGVSGSFLFLGACSFPSEVPNSNPADCVLDTGGCLMNIDLGTVVCGPDVPVELMSFTIE